MCIIRPQLAYRLNHPPENHLWMKNNTAYIISEFFMNYEAHLNSMLRSEQTASPQPLDEQIMELGPLGILFDEEQSNASGPHKVISLVSSDIRVLDGGYAIAAIRWAHQKEAGFSACYLLRLSEMATRMVASVTCDEDGVQDGLKLLYKMYFREQLNKQAVASYSAYAFSNN
jgi:hypothetical protein